MDLAQLNHGRQYTISINGQKMPHPVTLLSEQADEGQKYFLDGMNGAKRKIACWNHGDKILIALRNRPVECTLEPFDEPPST